MKKIINFLLVLALGACLGYFFHDPIDNQLKEWFNPQRVEKGKAIVEDGGDAIVDVFEDRKEKKEDE